jgi:hypothetical protein
LFGVQVSIAITEQKLLHIDLSANSDSAIFGGPVGALALEHNKLLFLDFSRPYILRCEQSSPYGSIVALQDFWV